MVRTNILNMFGVWFATVYFFLNLFLSSGEILETDDGFPINETSILFPDGDGRVHNISLEPESYMSARFFYYKSPTFLLCTRTNKTPTKIKEFTPEYLKAIGFNNVLDIKLITHGWRSDYLSESCVLMKEAYLQKKDLNVILIDWSSTANALYGIARINLELIAQDVADFIDFLIENINVSLEQIHLIGHSLGAHIAGITSSKIKSGKAKVVTGLDPAEPLFSLNHSESRLNKDDAHYVEVVHTAGHSMLAFIHPLGHADFYPNGGGPQPGCGFDLVGVCSHMVAYKLYAESILNDGMLAVHCNNLECALQQKCNDCKNAIKMGGIHIEKGDGLYYFSTHVK